MACAAATSDDAAVLDDDLAAAGSGEDANAPAEVAEFSAEEVASVTAKLNELYAHLGLILPQGSATNAAAVCQASPAPHNESIFQTPMPARSALIPDPSGTGSGNGDPPGSFV